MSAFLVVTGTCAGLLGWPPALQAGGEPLPQSTAVGKSPSTAQPVTLVAPVEAIKAPSNAPWLAAECDPLGTPVQCFTPANPATGVYLNVGSFFDQRRRSLDTHFFLKYFDNAAAVATEITGLGTYFQSNSAALQNILAAGVLKTSRTNPALPLPATLNNLQVVGVPIKGLGIETCIQLPKPVRLEANEAAWLIVRFPQAASSGNPFIGILADGDAVDADCDYMTPDVGQMYYRPDPLNGPKFDWAITAYTAQASSKASKLWAEVKVLYRDTDSKPTQ
jgi:hypothetical protein